MAESLIKEGNNSLFLAQRMGQVKQAEQNEPIPFQEKALYFLL